jgi:hypothetical protein
MNATTEQQPAPNRDEIASLAWRIWHHEGCGHGRELEDWLKAEQLLLIASQPGGKKTKNMVAKRKP